MFIPVLLENLVMVSYCHETKKNRYSMANQGKLLTNKLFIPKERNL